MLFMKEKEVNPLKSMLVPMAQVSHLRLSPGYFVLCVDGWYNSSFIHVFVYHFIHSFSHSFNHSFIHLFIYSFIHSFIHSFI